MHFFSDKVFFLPTAENAADFFPPPIFQAEQARWRLGKRGRREQQSSVTFLKDVQQVRVGIQVS